MPNRGGCTGRERFGLGAQLLRPVLAERALTRRERGFDRVERHRLRHRDERHRIRLAPRVARARSRCGRARSPADRRPARRRNPRCSRQHRDVTWRPVVPSRRYEKWSAESAVQIAAVGERVDVGTRERDADRGGEVERGLARAGAADDLGAEVVREPVEVARRRTRSARRGCTGRDTRARHRGRWRAGAPTVASITPPARPRCPACATPTASSHARTTGAQSAVMIASGSPGVVVTDGVGDRRRRRRTVGVARPRRRAPGRATPTRSDPRARPRRRPRCRLRTTDDELVTDVSRRRCRSRTERAEMPPSRPLHQTRTGPSAAATSSGRRLSARTRGRRSRRRRGRARRRRRASPRRRDRGSPRRWRTSGSRPSARLRSGRSRPRSR